MKSLFWKLFLFINYFRKILKELIALDDEELEEYLDDYDDYYDDYEDYEDYDDYDDSEYFDEETYVSEPWSTKMPAHVSIYSSDFQE